MSSRHAARWGATLTAVVAAGALSACQPETVSGGATAPPKTAASSAAPTSAADSPGTTGASTSDPGDADATGSATATTAAKRGPDGGSPQDHTAPNGVFGLHGGYLVDGSKVTFVYANGVRQTIDVGTPITHPTDAVVKSPKGTLTLTPTKATWRSTSHGESVVDAKGAGTIVSDDGLILVLPDGTASCANGDGMFFVDSDGRKAGGGTGGVFYVDKDGKQTTVDRPSSGGKTAGQFTQCAVGGQVSMDLFSDVLFAFDKAALTPAGKTVVAAAANTIKAGAHGKTVRITGHTDSKGTEAANKTLGLDRARSVAKQLKKQIPGLKVKVSSAGQAQPIAANTTPQGDDLPQGRAKNRRVTLTYAA